MYTEKLFGVMPLGTPAAVDLTSAAVHSFSHIFLSQVKLKRIALCVTTATVSSGNIVVTFRKRPTPGSSSGQSTVGTITIPTGIAAGKVYYKDVSPVVFAPGDQLIAEVTTAAAGGGAAGAAAHGFEGEDDPEYAGNQTDMVESA